MTLSLNKLHAFGVDDIACHPTSVRAIPGGVRRGSFLESAASKKRSYSSSSSRTPRVMGLTGTVLGLKYGACPREASLTVQFSPIRLRGHPKTGQLGSPKIRPVQSGQRGPGGTPEFGGLIPAHFFPYCPC